MAKQQKKWLLVNIQADAEFDCHRLNRDVWKDEMVQNIIACNCIFWQVRGLINGDFFFSSFPFPSSFVSFPSFSTSPELKLLK